MTNEERLRSMPTERLAVVLAALVGDASDLKKVVYICLGMPDTGFSTGGNSSSMHKVMETWIKWLKEEATGF